jgi:hypothetical protein
MIEDVNAASQAPAGSSREFQVYPPLPGYNTGGVGSTPLPPLDPSGLPPEGAIPTIIDPGAPPASGGTPLPTVTPTNDTFPTPTQSVPLPPNDAEINAGKPTPPPTEVPKEAPKESLPEPKKEEPKPPGQ